MKNSPWSWANLGALLIMLSLATLFSVSARRGLDMTDEGYYLVSFLHWRQFQAFFSAFGVYLSMPFLLFGKSIFAIRLFGFFMIVSSSAFFGWALFRLVSERNTVSRTEILLPALILSCCAVNHFANFRTLTMPSYNTVALTCMLISTALLFSIASNANRSNQYSALVYGFVLSVCVFSKFSTAVVLSAWHLALAWTLREPLRGKLNLQILIYCLLGFAANVLILIAFAPDLLQKMTLGIQYQAIVYPRNIASEMTTIILSEIPNSLLQPIIHGALVGSAAFALAYANRLGNPLIFDMAIVAFIAWIVCYPNFQDYSSRTSELGLLFLFLWAIRKMASKGNKPDQKNWTTPILLLVFSMPFAYSIGTNTPFLSHMSMAIAFSFSACIAMLFLLRNDHYLSYPAYVICLFLLGSTALITLLKPWVHQVYTYQLGTSLIEQTVTTVMPDTTSTLQLDAKFSSAIARYNDTLRTSGFRSGMTMLDFTSMPSLVFLAGGIPVAVPCIHANFSGSDNAAHWILERVALSELKNAWIITSDDYIGRLDAKKIITARIGEFPFELAGEFVLPYANMFYGPRPPRNTQDVTIKIWRPLPQRPPDA